MRLQIVALAVVAVALVASTAAAECIGEFEQCASTLDCVLIKADCGKCGAGQYLCPSRSQCVADFADCSGLAGTFWDWTLPLEQRVALVVNATTLDEQIQQLQNSAPSIPRLYIPKYQWLNDDLHGVRRTEATSFPNGCGLGATWAPDTLDAVGTAIGTEARALHHWYTNLGNRGEDGYWNGLGMTIYGPNVNLVRDPRWGRNQEVNSEDPYLTSQLTEAIVKGTQKTERGYTIALACCKHFAVYDIESFPTPRNVYDAVVDNRNLYETYLPVFEACARRAKVGHFMCSYNSVNGVPACGNKALLTDILRTQWNFTGFVVSDYDAWAQIYQTHKYCPNITCAAATGINAGCDQEGGGDAAINALPAAIAAGLVQPERVRESFRRLFRARFRLGMFDPPTLVPFSSYPTSKISSPHHMELALQAARESLCLYKNNNSALPLKMNSKIAVVGANGAATYWLQGNYGEPPAWGVVSILEGIANANAPNTPCAWDAAGVDYHLPNDTFIASDSGSSCATACAADLSCNYFTYSAGRCYRLKSMWNAHLTTDLSVQSGARPGLCLTTQGEDWTQTGDQPVRSEDARECCQRCRAQPNCTRFTYNTLLGCFLSPTAKVAWKNPLSYSGASSAKVPSVTFAEACLDGNGCSNTSGFGAAAAAAAAADATVVVLGLDQGIESEGHDRSTIQLPAGQYALVNLLRAAAGSKPVIAVLVHGGTFVLSPVLSTADAVVDAWYPSQQGGNAIADVLFGFYSPAGRASATYYASDADLPPNLAQQDLYPNATSGYKGLTYRYFTGRPDVAFGTGLSYTTFAYSKLSAPASVTACGALSVNVTVTNTGSRTSDEVVQLYVQQVKTSVPAPAIRLADFQRTRALAPGESRVISLRVSPEYRSVVHASSDAYADARFVEAGTVVVHVGGGQPGFTSGTLSATVAVTGSAPLAAC